MSQLTMTADERVLALEGYGYTTREAAFLCLAALHGGYFLRRQYHLFLNKQAGGTAAALIEKAITRDHIKVSTYGHHTHVYHLCRRPFYAALGQTDNRNRRQRQPLTIKNRLMGLDFVLTHPHHEYLPTEQEKLAYFNGTLGIDIAEFPTKMYRSPAGSCGVTTRYFVDKCPIFLSGTPTVGTFCFVDEGAASLSGFETYLNQYGRLLRALRRFQVIYVAATQFLFKPAEAMFERFLNQLRASGGTPLDPTIRRMLDHYAARRLFESKDFSSFDRAKLIRLRQDQQEFSGAQHEALYEQWKDGGDASVLQNLGIKQSEHAPIHGSFSTHLLEYDYGFFGSLATF